MNTYTRREITELLSIAGCNDSGRRMRREFADGALSIRRPKQTGVAVWVVLLLVIAGTGTFWGANQLCGLLAQNTRQMQRHYYRPQMAYSDLWNKGRH